jgi:hypothetical protein
LAAGIAERVSGVDEEQARGVVRGVCAQSRTDLEQRFTGALQGAVRQLGQHPVSLVIDPPAVEDGVEWLAGSRHHRSRRGVFGRATQRGRTDGRWRCERRAIGAHEATSGSGSMTCRKGLEQHVSVSL